MISGLINTIIILLKKLLGLTIMMIIILFYLFSFNIQSDIPQNVYK